MWCCAKTFGRSCGRTTRSTEFDHAINTAIKKIRQALGDSAEDPTYIETVARRGYRLMAPVEWVECWPTES